jgi:hypothetical protein
MSISTLDRESWIGSTLTDSENRRLGTIEEIYCDEQTGRPLWMVVKTGVFGTRRSFVPLAGAMPADDAIMTPCVKSQIDGAPKLDPTEDLPEDRVRELYRYYGLPYGAPVDGDTPDAPSDTPAQRVMKYLM